MNSFAFLLLLASSLINAQVTFTATKCPLVTQVSGSVPVVTKCLVVPTGVPTGVVSDVQSQGILSGIVGVSASIGSLYPNLRALFESSSFASSFASSRIVAASAKLS
ncbi:hypothetical protein BCR33DRAFT_859978 [Rhizoclosmatium globosum]|uniref:Hydrophobin n=1 Tax=Rhizoclosmatium globosum TaxID=329046 RepID=A0A1Y2AS26_9FUNG|nr:hypothetical protein BCR33DRAFT_859978 [Rhizoclosmatium globosum]|eukprot:ORY25100.1 hypothetical protein BCR33DRAFT_859978 [Rhizoclosmatium globosum]